MGSRDSLALTHSHRLPSQRQYRWGCACACRARQGRAGALVCLLLQWRHPSIPVTVQPPPLPAAAFSNRIGNGSSMCDVFLSVHCQCGRDQLPRRCCWARLVSHDRESSLALAVLPDAAQNSIVLIGFVIEKSS